MAHPGEDLIRSGYEAFARRDIPAVMSMLSEDIIFHVPGRSHQSGDFVGKGGVSDYFARVREIAGTTHQLEVHDVLANDTHVVALLRAFAEGNGKTFDMNVVHVWHLAGRLATELWIIPGDQYAFDEFWT